MSARVALASHNARIALARAAYWAQTHCHSCGTFVQFDPSHRENRICDDPECQREAKNAGQRARYSRKGAA